MNKSKAGYRVAERLAQEQGARRAFRVLQFIGCWGICCEKFGRPPVNVEEYVEYWGLTRAKGYREQQEFRECLPEYDTPTAIYEAARREYPDLFKKSPAVVAVRLGGVL